MDGISLSEDELRGLSEDGDDPTPDPSVFQPADFADASRIGHRLFGAAASRISSRLGGAESLLPPEIRLTQAAEARASAASHPQWAFVLEFTGQFRATAVCCLRDAQGVLPAISSETATVLVEQLARDAEVVFLRELRRAVAVSVRTYTPVGDDFPVALPPGSGLVSLCFDLEIGSGASTAFTLFAESSFVRELAALARGKEVRKEAREERAEEGGADDERASFPAAPAALLDPAPLELEDPLADEVTVELSAEIGRSSVLLSELLAMSQGQVVRLDRLAGETALLCHRGRPMATGEVVVQDGYLALRLLEVAPPEQLAAEPRVGTSTGRRAPEGRL